MMLMLSSRARAANRAYLLPRLAILALLPFLGLGVGPAQASHWIECDTGVPAASMRFFDAHNHLQFSTAEIAEDKLDELGTHGVSLGMLALGVQNEGLLEIALDLQADDDYAVFALVNPPHYDDGAGNKTFDGTSLASVQFWLGQGARGIGEVILRHSGPPSMGADIPADQETAMDFYAEAAARDVPVSFHFEVRDKADPGTDIESRVQELRNAVSGNPNTTFIWSHAGDTGPTVVRALIEDYPNLYADISTRNPYFERDWPAGLQSLGSGTDGFGPLKTAWKELFEDYPDRFMFGLDLASETRWDQLGLVMTYYRGVLAQVSQETAEKIACKNARALLLSTSAPAAGVPLGGPLITLLAATGALGLWLRQRRS